MLLMICPLTEYGEVIRGAHSPYSAAEYGAFCRSARLPVFSGVVCFTAADWSPEPRVLVRTGGDVPGGSAPACWAAQAVSTRLWGFPGDAIQNAAWLFRSAPVHGQRAVWRDGAAEPAAEQSLKPLGTYQPRACASRDAKRHATQAHGCPGKRLCCNRQPGRVQGCAALAKRGESMDRDASVRNSRRQAHLARTRSETPMPTVE